MDKLWKKYNNNTSLLLNDFNSRNPSAFSYIYNKYYKEFHLYAASLYVNTIVESKDAVQDVFMHILKNETITFKGIINIKAYVIIMLKNRFRNYIQHMECERRYNERLTDVDETFEIDILENSLYTIAEEMLSLLPSDSAEILRLYIDGWKPEEIAQKLSKPIQTIYNKKSEAIVFLRNKATKEKLLIFMIFIS